MTLAAVCAAVDAPLRVEELSLDAPQPGEIRVRLGAAGVCGSDLSVLHGTLSVPLPTVLGHEGVGVVTALGPDVEHLAEGNRVAIAAMPQCGVCRQCARGRHSLCERSTQVMLTGGLQDGTPRFRNGCGQRVHQFTAAGTFAEDVVVSAISAVKIPDDVPFAAASILGCGVLTGAGAALNTASIEAGDTVAVIGCGTVGLSALQGARIAGAAEIIAIDMRPSKLAVAGELGATATVDARTQDPVSIVRELTGRRGADVTIEAVGAQMAVDQAIRMTGHGGEVVFVGIGTPGVRIDLPQLTGLVLPAKTLKGCLFGSVDLQRDVPRLIDHYRAGEFQLDRLISETFALEQINDAFGALSSGELVSAVIELP